jgi:hypothetical protein
VPYIINNSNGDAIVIPDGALNQDYSIDLVGRNYENYGVVIAKTQVDLLDNFASTSPPVRATDGQLWYDKSTKQIRIYDFPTGGWLPSGIQVSATPLINVNGQLKAGTSYYDTTQGQFFVHDGSSFREGTIAGGSISTSSIHSGTALGGTPAEYGSRIRHMFVTDTNDVKRSVLGIVYTNDLLNTGANFYNSEQFIAIFSGHPDTFVIKDAASSELGGITTFNAYAQLVDGGDGIGNTIHPGMNVRKDSTAVAPVSTLAQRAAAAYKLNTGTVGADGANISASAVYHSGADSIPAVTNTVDLGSASKVFAAGYINGLELGNGTTGSLIKNGSSIVNIGTLAAPIDQIFVSDLITVGNISSTGDLGNATNRVGNIWADYINTTSLSVDGYTFPLSAGAAGEQLFIDNTGQLYWDEPVSDIAAITAGAGIDLTLTSNTAITAGSAVYAKQLDLAVNTAFVKNQLSAGANINYNNTTGVINLDYTTPFDTFAPSDFVKIGTTQTVSGEKTFTPVQTFTAGINIGDHINFAQAGGYATTKVLRFIGTNSAYVEITPNGGIVAQNDITAFSDERLKTNLEVITGALSKVNSLSGYVYDRTDIKARQSGLLAQQVQTVLPEVVHTAQDGTLSVAYGNMVGLLVEAIKELSTQVEDLKKQLDEK